MRWRFEIFAVEIRQFGRSFLSEFLNGPLRVELIGWFISARKPLPCHIHHGPD